jgi:hypothetical protein
MIQWQGIVLPINPENNVGARLIRRLGTLGYIFA